jgi:hypothetical protein
MQSRGTLDMGLFKFIGALGLHLFRQWLSVKVFSGNFLLKDSNQFSSTYLSRAITLNPALAQIQFAE